MPHLDSVQHTMQHFDSDSSGGEELGRAGREELGRAERVDDVDDLAGVDGKVCKKLIWVL